MEQKSKRQLTDDVREEIRRQALGRVYLYLLDRMPDHQERRREDKQDNSEALSESVQVSNQGSSD